ncbi:hypothetical protein EDD37DRAFT_648674 [Exophiala viscosa]|uniref:uncharacterized protein n=1 Tax=Exophiala viscosa TaxID=2486360 RepID=UPI00218CA446|nr:hypothetical protein EDD37DRAFT_648674 [Exophiala viscosa]
MGKGEVVAAIFICSGGFALVLTLAYYCLKERRNDRRSTNATPPGQENEADQLRNLPGRNTAGASDVRPANPPAHPPTPPPALPPAQEPAQEPAQPTTPPTEQPPPYTPPAGQEEALGSPTIVQTGAHNVNHVQNVNVRRGPVHLQTAVAGNANDEGNTHARLAELSLLPSVAHLPLPPYSRYDPRASPHGYTDVIAAASSGGLNEDDDLTRQTGLHCSPAFRQCSRTAGDASPTASTDGVYGDEDRFTRQESAAPGLRRSPAIRRSSRTVSQTETLNQGTSSAGERLPWAHDTAGIGALAEATDDDEDQLNSPDSAASASRQFARLDQAIGANQALVPDSWAERR